MIIVWGDMMLKPFALGTALLLSTLAPLAAQAQTAHVVLADAPPPVSYAVPVVVTAPVVPAHEAGNRILTGTLPAGSVIAVPGVMEPRVPPGYRRAWEDGRLNPYAGKQLLSGALQQALVWTQTVPRRLKTEDGRDVTSRYNYLVYPFTDYAKQRAALGSGQFVTVETTAGRAIVPVR